MKVSDILTEEIIEINLEAPDKNDAINKMIELANNSGNIIDLEAVGNVFSKERNLFRRE